MATAVWPNFDAAAKIDSGGAHYRVAMAAREHPATRIPRYLAREEGGLGIITSTREEGVWDTLGEVIYSGTMQVGIHGVFADRFAYDNGGNIMYAWIAINADTSTYWIYTLYVPWSGQPVLTKWKDVQPTAPPDRISDSLALDINTNGEFVLSWIQNRLYPAWSDDINDMVFATWDAGNRVWIDGDVFGKANNLGRPLPLIIGSNLGPRNHDMAISHVDGKYHFLTNFHEAGSPTREEWYYIRYDPKTHTETEWEKLEDLDYPLEAAHVSMMASNVYEDVVFIMVWNFHQLNNSESEVVFWTNESGSWLKEVISTRATGPSTPDIFVDYNDDIYIVWAERRPGAGPSRAIMARRRLAGTWESEIITTGTFDTSDFQNRSGTRDPEHPKIIRPHRGRPLLEFNVVWGSGESAVQSDTWIWSISSQVRETEPGELEFNNTQVRRFDGVVGGSWASMVGKDV
jgi:hypothetical protein